MRVSTEIIKICNLVPESVRLFGLGMESPIDILKAVEIDANSPNTMGRGIYNSNVLDNNNVNLIIRIFMCHIQCL